MKTFSSADRLYTDNFSAECNLNALGCTLFSFLFVLCALFTLLFQPQSLELVGTIFAIGTCLYNFLQQLLLTNAT